MIQRIQTLYLLLACVICVTCMSSGIGHFYTQDGLLVTNMYNLWLTNADGQHNMYPWALFVILLIASTVSFLSIFLFTRRALQMRATSFAILMLVGWYIAFGVFVYLLCGEMEASFRPHCAAALPAAAIVLLYLAFRGIMKDEMLVRSLDRLR